MEYLGFGDVFIGCIFFYYLFSFWHFIYLKHIEVLTKDVSYIDWKNEKDRRLF